MADLSLALTISGNSRGATRAVRELQGALKDLGATSAQTQQQVARATGGLRFGAALGAGTAVAGRAVDALLGGVGALGDALIGANVRLEQTEATFRALTGSATEAQRIIEELRREADVTPFSTEELVQAGAALSAVSRAAQVDLMELVRTAEALAAAQPSQGLEGAAFALREAVLGGDFQSVIDRFNLSRTTINRLREEGVPALQAVEAAMREAGATSALVRQLADTFPGLTSNVVSFFQEFARRLGEGLFVRLEDALRAVSNALARNRDALLDWASRVGSVVATVAQRVAAQLGELAVHLLNLFQAGLGDELRDQFRDLTQGIAETGQAAERAAPPAQALKEALTLPEVERQLAAANRELATTQRHLEGVRQGYEDQLRPLQEQLRALQQARDLQALNRALAANRASQELIVLDAQLARARQRVGATDPDAPDLTPRQRLQALALRELQLRRDALALEKERAPQEASLEDRIRDVEQAQEAALAPLERSLRLRQAETQELQAQRERLQGLAEAAETAAQEARRKIAEGVGQGADDALAEARKRQEPFRQEGENWADKLTKGLEKGWRAWLDARGKEAWGSITASFNTWYEHGGEATLVATGGRIGQAIVSGMQQELRAWLDERLDLAGSPTGPGSHVRRPVGGAPGGLPPPGALPPAGGVPLGPGVDALVTSEAATDPGASPRLPGVGR